MTREEIVTALRCCADDSGCDACPRADVPESIESCNDGLSLAAADLIENQQREIDALRQANEGLRFNLAAYASGKRAVEDASPYAVTTDSADVGGGVPDAPQWCADCHYFEACDPSGAGECKAPEPKVYVWYGRVACENFRAKEVSP